MKKYSVIYSDPPWPQKHSYKKRIDGKVIHYPLMTKFELLEMGTFVRRLSADDCEMFMWTTGENLAFSIQLMHVWGFQYKTMAFVWVKTTVTGKLVYNYSPVTNPSCEFVIRGVKGKTSKAKTRSIYQTLIEARSHHSAKPHEIRQRIEKLRGKVPRLEMFARERFPGWDTLGNEVDSDVTYIPGKEY